MLKNYIAIFLGVILLASCHSSKKMAKDADAVSSKVETLDAKKKAPKHTEISSKVKVKVIMDGKDVSTSGQLKMRWNDVIQVSLVDPVLGVMEVGRMEISVDSILVVDRLNKRYVSETYETLSRLSGLDITHDVVQDLFWRQIEGKGNNDVLSFTLPFRKPVTMEIKLGSLNYDSGWNGHTEVSSKYQKVSMEALLKAMLNNE